MKLKITTWTLLAILVLYSCKTSLNERENSASAIVVNNENYSQTKVEKLKPQSKEKSSKEGEISFETANLKETESLIFQDSY